MKLSEIIPLIRSSNICITVGSDFYYYEEHTSIFRESLFNENTLTESEVLSLTVKAIVDGANGIIISVE